MIAWKLVDVSNGCKGCIYADREDCVGVTFLDDHDCSSHGWANMIVVDVDGPIKAVEDSR